MSRSKVSTRNYTARERFVRDLDPRDLDLVRERRATRARDFNLRVRPDGSIVTRAGRVLAHLDD